MSYNELRKDYLLNRWVVVATERARRPTDFFGQKREAVASKDDTCPMCPGNEHLTPPAVLVYLNRSGQIHKEKDSPGLLHKNWLIRCVPNLFPAFAPPKKQTDLAEIMKNAACGSAIGHHEVLIESPDHNAHPADAELPQLVHVVNAYVDRMRDLAAKPYVRYVSVFRNHGQQAGASLSHAHSQVIAMPFVPTTVDEETKASANFWKKHGKCVFCDLIEKESKGPRFVENNIHFAVFAPYASVNPMEFWILPTKHATNPFDMTQTEAMAFAITLRSTLRGLKNLVNDPPYNYGIHLSIDQEAYGYYHWHVEVYPKLAIWAGFEKSTGVYINTVPPEIAAAELQKAMRI